MDDKKESKNKPTFLGDLLRAIAPAEAPPKPESSTLVEKYEPMQEKPGATGILETILNLFAGREPEKKK
jgi:hypothetical protein